LLIRSKASFNGQPEIEKTRAKEAQECVRKKEKKEKNEPLSNVTRPTPFEAIRSGKIIQPARRKKKEKLSSSHIAVACRVI
jgi:hypothetical protein